MQFEATVLGEKYVFSSVSQNSFLVSSPKAEYIIYKTATWHCADEIPSSLLRKMGEAIDSRQSASLQLQ